MVFFSIARAACVCSFVGDKMKLQIISRFINLIAGSAV